ncbi:UNVERIFIED_CONTAM: hypothetical protein RMT77_015415 [Armadillidium vulgare]
MDFHNRLQNLQYNLKRRFQCVDYDFTQNYLSYNRSASRNELVDINEFSIFCNYKRFFSLYYYALSSLVVHVYKDSEIVEEIKKTIYSFEDPINLTDKDVLDMKDLECKVLKKFEEHCKSKSIDLYELRSYKFPIHNVLLQIYDFLIKGGMHDSIHVNRYIKNLMFSSQGTINLKKTILRILKEPYLSLISKFEVACHHFIDDSTIRELYHTAKNEESIDFSSNTKFVTDYSLYYWEWEILGTRRLVTETSSFYLQSRSPWSRADVQNDVAVLIIFQKAVEDNNELAVRYLWNNHISKRAKKEDQLSNVLKLSVSSPTKINICLFFLFQIKYNELNRVLNEISFVILKYIIKKVRWHCLFIEIFKELQPFLSLQDMAELLYCLIESFCRNYPMGITFNMLSDYLASIPRSAEARVIANWEQFERILLQCFTVNENLITSLFNGWNLKKEFKPFICSSYGRKFLGELIKKGNFELVDKLIGFEDSEMQEVKSLMNVQYVYPICKELIQSHQFDRLFLFIEWWSRSLSSERVHSFKNEIIEINKSKLEVAFSDFKSFLNRETLKDIDFLFIWYFLLEKFASKLKDKLQFRGDQEGMEIKEPYTEKHSVDFEDFLKN